MADELTLRIEFSFDPPSGLFRASLENGASFSVAPINVSGKLGSNLDLLRQFTTRERGGNAPSPHVASQRPHDFGASKDAKLVEEAIAAGKLRKIDGKKVSVTLEDLDL